ncbi:TetR/AcrR family transcriptional regulator [Nocardia panacis]|uniref:TetR/AcrR family transcriptional regulator n=1 Tax=Nocardia panacis TaxID=2340916 RepID=A0A3A4K0T3_9NOCA|nr:TetR/AcrR family transcriptional regulator [Nocardia panacis]RJO70903.1 TetR/AcrR family transcriptional regulator [Nocardia panacis]
MSSTTRRPRADAVRNIEKILVAARAVFSERGARAQLGEVAAAAGVSEATLYRHFAGREELILEVLRRRFAEDVAPVAALALQRADPWQAMVDMLEVVLEVAEREQHTFAAALSPDIFAELAVRYFEDFGTVLRRAQEAGVVRADLVAADLPRLTTMLIAAQRLGGAADAMFLGMGSAGGGSGNGWRRYLALLLDAMRPAAATALPPFVLPSDPR